MNIRDALGRTRCKCKECSTFCYHMPGLLIPGDQHLLAEYLGETLEQLKLHLLASPGAIVMKTNGEKMRIPTLVPARKSDGSCVWLEKNGDCKVHKVSPAGCACLDSHMRRQEADDKVKVILHSILGNTEYLKLWMDLWEMKRTTVGPEVLREKIRKARRSR